jgi:hypothetical protein
MKQTCLTILVLCIATLSFAQTKEKKRYKPASVTVASAETTIPADVQGTWMYGNFSTTEYWSKAPATYLGNALTFAIAFAFHADGTYDQYFTSSSVLGGIATYHQSFTKGRFTVNAEDHTITTIPSFSHYKRTKMGKTEEDRDMRPSEIAGSTTYTYKKSTEPNGTEAIRLTIQGTNSPLTFLKKQF